ncbi:hypothetical protein T439DRAFT_342117 [Meredithblackwellia eburnea MCA 4105]
MSNQLQFSALVEESLDLWCSNDSNPAWDGVDLSKCFRRRILNGIVPLTFLTISISSFLLILIYRLFINIFPPSSDGALPLSTASKRRLSTSSRSRSRSRAGSGRARSTSIVSSSSVEITAQGPTAIAEAENEVILGVVQEQSPDLDLKDVLAMGVGAGNVKHALDTSALDDDDEADEIATGPVTAGTVLKALWGTKKDILNVLGSAALMALLVVRLKDNRRVDGVNWYPFIITAWAWTLFLTLAKLAVSFKTRLRRLRVPHSVHHISSWYTLLEIHFIPWLFVYTSVTFFDVRSALIDHFTRPNVKVDFGIEIAIFSVTFALLIVELFAPRPSRFASRARRGTESPTAAGPQVEPAPSPELNACLFSIATFSFVDSFMFRHAFPTSTTPPLNIDAVPDLRPDDRTARVLLGFRRDGALLNARTGSTWGLTARLVWYFRYQLAEQQLWSLIRVATVVLPPMFLKGILSYLKRRNEGIETPFHVALLFAFALFFFQIIAALSGSLSLYIGRRICIRLRSIIVGEVFTKTLRRKDMAGSSAKEEKPNTDAPADTPAKPEKGAEDEEEEEGGRASTGKILQLISVDTFRLSEICAYLHFVFPEMSLTIVVTVFLLFQVLGWSAAAGLVVLLLMAPLQGACSRRFYVYQKKLLAAADARLNLATEVIASVRIVKYFAWERKFLEKMAETREKELSALWKRSQMMIVGGVVMFGSPVSVSVATFVFHTKILKRDLTAEIAFTSLALFNVLRSPLEGFTDMIVNILQAHVSLKRIDTFLAEEETAKYSVIQEPSSIDDPVIGFKNASFTWADEQLANDDPTVFRLHHLNLSFPVGQMSIVLGPVGSGKSTLLSSLLGETNKLAGASYLPSPVVRASGEDPSILTDTTAYCSQTAWLLSDTIRENILFGSAHNEARYQAVLEACALLPDLKQFELGDATEVGEKGTVLSGGQKARISLARAIYSPAKTVLLDDVLSAVDSHTAQHIVSRCFKGRLMRHRSCVLVTHAVDLCLPESAFVVSMDNGVVITSGPPHLLSSNEATALPTKAEIQEAAASAVTIEALAEGNTDEGIEVQVAEEKRKRQEELKLVKEETQNEGAVSREVYMLYLKAFGGWTVGLLALAIFVGAQLSEIGVSLALRYWANSYDQQETSASQIIAITLHTSVNRWRAVASHMFQPVNTFATLTTFSTTSDYWLKLYCLIGFVNLSLYALRVGFFLYRGVVASRVVYVELIDKILGAKTRFFDSTPTGRILNRLSKDMETIDQDVANSLMFLTLEIMSVAGIIGTISVALPAFLIAAVFIVLAYWLIGYIYISSSRELKRSESVTRSPIFGLVGETLSGVATIRAYGDPARFTKNIFRMLDINNRPFFTLWQGNRWLSVRVDIAGAFVSLAAAVFVLSANRMDAALGGFVISFAIAFNERILWLVRLWSQVEINFNSVERVREYLDIDQESKVGVIPPAIWPSRDCTIEVQGLTASYAPELPPVLKNVSFKIKPREKIGICGRTGSGKSTLGLSFFRFIEPTSGRIVIDGLDINTLSLPELRSRLTIVAQDAALFAGTLRFNMDPFDVYEDSEIWDALRRVQMASPGTGATPRESRAPSRVPSIKGQDDEEGSETTAAEGEEKFVVKSLDMLVSTGGSNFSAGQRQLLALARGILKLSSSSILLLDESTASLDQATDERIQETIRKEMSDATILCIAHRLRTIVDYDKILVLDHGKVLEFDTPANLLAQDGSAFSALCQKSGEYDSLLKIANAKRDGGSL